MSIQIPNKFLSDPEWHLVGDVIQEALESVAFLPEATTSPTDFKSQVLANKRIKKAMETFLVQAQVLTQMEKEKNPFI
jgi:hypothetical protein